jgi:hypothetical protein
VSQRFIDLTNELSGLLQLAHRQGGRTDNWWTVPRQRQLPGLAAALGDQPEPDVDGSAERGLELRDDPPQHGRWRRRSARGR